MPTLEGMISPPSLLLAPAKSHSLSSIPSNSNEIILRIPLNQSVNYFINEIWSPKGKLRLSQ